MKKLSMILALSVAFFMGTKTYAQEGLSFGVKVGGNFSNFSGSDFSDELDSKLGFQLGLTAEYGLSDNLFIGSGLEFTTKGARAKEELGPVTMKTSINPMYLQLPVHIGFKFEVANGVNLLAEVGPYAAFGIGGKSKVTIKIGDEKETEKNNFFGSEDEGGAKRFDFGVGGAIGAEFGKVVVKAGYDLGLADISRFDDGDNKVKNGNLFLTLGFKF